MNVKRTFIVFFLVVFAAALFVACNKSSGGVEYEISVKNESGKLVSTKVVNSSTGNSVTPPAKETGRTFVGFYSVDGTIYFDAEGKQIEGRKITGDLDLFYRWDNHTCKIDLDAGEGTLSSGSTVTVKYGDYIGALPVPYLEGYDFLGWKNAGGTLVSSSSGELSERYEAMNSSFDLDEDYRVTLTASYEARKLTVILDYGSVAGAKNQTLTVSYGETIELPTTDFGNGKICVGWGNYQNTSPSLSFTEFGPVTYDYTLYAVVVDYRYVNLVYSPDNVKRLMLRSDINEYILPAGEEANKEYVGYNCTGWYTSQTLSGGTRVEKVYYYDVVDTVYAASSPIEYSLAFKNEDGSPYSGGSFDRKYTVEAEDLTFPTPAARDSYEFKGWYTAKEGGEKVTAESVMNVLGDQTLYARWIYEASVTFNANSSVLPISVGLTKMKGVVSCGSDTITGIATDNNKYYDVEGWYSSATGGYKIAYADGRLCTNTVYTDDEGKWIYEDGVTLYAQWKNASAYSGYTFIANEAKYSSYGAMVRNHSIDFASIGKNGKYLLIEDIDLGNKNWTPIDSFSGTLDGDGHKISNLQLLRGSSDDNHSTNDSEIYFGLFGRLEGGTITNLKLDNFYIEVWKYKDNQSDNYGGLLVGFSSQGTITNIQATNCYLYLRNLREVGKNVSFWVYVGGLVGRINGGTISNCRLADSKIEGQASKPSGGGSVRSYLGGIVGYADGLNADMLISDCESYNNYLRVSAADNEAGSGITALGGICGIMYHEESFSAIIRDCTSSVADPSKHSSANKDPGMYMYKTNDSNLKMYTGSILGRKHAGSITGCTSTITVYYRSHYTTTDKQTSLPLYDE